MSDETTRNHPGIEALAGLSDGRLENNEAEIIRTHVDGCSDCRLEIKRLQRFEGIETDQELATEARWQSAKSRLEDKFHKNILPELGIKEATREQAPKQPFWYRWRLQWLVPAAATAAAVLFIFSVVDRDPSVDPGPMRGPGIESAVILIDQPSGDLTEAPKVFSWKTTAECEFYSIEIFTADLKKIYTEGEIPETRWVATDSLKTLLATNTIYLWNVVGHKGLEPETVSPNGWFKITPDTSR
jgi:hypothetical protein